jgi:NADPH:quinone reductase-like Zn-dependent oxidoreductase
MADSTEIGARAGDLFAAFLNEQIKIAIDRTLPLARAAEAHAIIEGRQTKGKLLLEVPAST